MFLKPYLSDNRKMMTVNISDAAVESAPIPAPRATCPKNTMHDTIVHTSQVLIRPEVGRHTLLRTQAAALLFCYTTHLLTYGRINIWMRLNLLLDDIPQVGDISCDRKKRCDNCDRGFHRLKVTRARRDIPPLVYNSLTVHNSFY